MKDADDNLVEAFALASDPLPELREALVKAAVSLEGCDCGVDAELVLSYGQRPR